MIREPLSFGLIPSIDALPAGTAVVAPDSDRFVLTTETQEDDGHQASSLLDGAVGTYWESDGHCPHYGTIKFETPVTVAAVVIYIDASDGNYCPQDFSLQAHRAPPLTGDFNCPFHLPQTTGWHLCPVIYPDDAPCPLSSVRFAVEENHSGGCDTRIHCLTVLEWRGASAKTHVPRRIHTLHFAAGLGAALPPALWPATLPVFTSFRQCAEQAPFPIPAAQPSALDPAESVKLLASVLPTDVAVFGTQAGSGSGPLADEPVLAHAALLAARSGFFAHRIACPASPNPADPPAHVAIRLHDVPQALVKAFVVHAYTGDLRMALAAAGAESVADIADPDKPISVSVPAIANALPAATPLLHQARRAALGGLAPLFAVARLLDAEPLAQACESVVFAQLTSLTVDKLVTPQFLAWVFAEGSHRLQRAVIDAFAATLSAPAVGNSPSARLYDVLVQLSARHVRELPLEVLAQTINAVGTIQAQNRKHEASLRNRAHDGERERTHDDGLGAWVAAPAPYDTVTVGATVRVCPACAEPTFGFGVVTHSSVGRVVQIGLETRDDGAIVCFPEQPDWLGVLGDLQVVVRKGLLSSLSEATPGVATVPGRDVGEVSEDTDFGDEEETILFAF
jgi:hypothetical protein